jgi:hypothetical protein
MPALWPSFIPALAGDIAGQSFTKAGGALVSYALPKVGKDQVPIFPPSPALIESLKPGNPLNADLSINPLDLVNAINLNPLSGRYDFGVRVAERYIAAVKGLAMTPFGATHTNNGAAEFLLKQGYGLVFERILKEGDIPLQDQKDKDGKVIKMGKESHPAYADFCPGPIAMPDPVEEEKKQKKKFNQFIEKFKADPAMDLKQFKFFEFHCLDGKETQKDFIQLLVNRLLQQFETYTKADDKWDYFSWVESLGKERYKNITGINLGGNDFNSLKPYPNIPMGVRSSITKAGYKWEEVADGVRDLFLKTLEPVFPVFEKTVNNTTTKITDWEKRIKNGAKAPIVKPWPFDPAEKPECPLNRYRIQVSFNREHNPPDNPSKRPEILTDQFITTFSYDKSPKKSFIDSLKTIEWYDKDAFYTLTNYKTIEYDMWWMKVPDAISGVRKPEDIVNIDPKLGGTNFKFQRQEVIDAIAAAKECDDVEADSGIDYTWPGGDPYEEMAEITIAYWYACIVKPFAPTPAALPALIPAPLGGIYIPIYYGGKKRLANNLRKAWNSGKAFATLPIPAPPALVVATAVAAAYALHLLEFKLLYLGGIPTPAGPVPMVGIVPVVF